MPDEPQDATLTGLSMVVSVGSDSLFSDALPDGLFILKSSGGIMHWEGIAWLSRRLRRSGQRWSPFH